MANITWIQINIYYSVLVVLLRPPCVADADIIFLSCFFLFFPRLISAVEIEGLRDVAMATSFGTKIVINGFMLTIATRRLVMGWLRIVQWYRTSVFGWRAFAVLRCG